MRIMWMLLFCCVALHALAQDEITYQPDSIYKKNKVKARIILYNYSRYKTKKVDLFDHEGRLVSHIEYDTSGDKILFRYTRTYTTAHYIAGEVFYDYRHYDSVTKKHMTGNVADTLITKVVYDTIRRWVHKTSVTKQGNKRYESFYRDDSLKLTESWYFQDGVSENLVNWLDKRGGENRILDTIHLLNGTALVSDYRYKNYFDNTGRPVRSRVKKVNESVVASTSFYFKEISYEYARNGLLIQKNLTEPSNNEDWLLTQIFDYKYW